MSGLIRRSIFRVSTAVLPQTELNQLIAQELARGRYASQDELLVEAVRLLGERDRIRDYVDPRCRR